MVHHAGIEWLDCLTTANEQNGTRKPSSPLASHVSLGFQDCLPPTPTRFNDCHLVHGGH